MYSAALLAFLIPLSKQLSTYAILIWVIASLLMWVPRGKNKWMKAGLWSMGLFYIFHLTGLLYTSNMDFAMLDIGMKASFILMPIIYLVAKRFTSNQVDLILGTFVLAVIGKGVFLLGQAILEYSSNGDVAVFYYSDFSRMHPSYSAMYALFAFSFLVLARAGKRNFFGFRQKWLFGILLTFLLVLVNLFASKAGVLIAPLLIIALSIFIARFRSSVRKGLVYGVTLLAIFSFSLFFSSNTLGRLQQMLEVTNDISEETNADQIADEQKPKTSLESTTARLAAWNASLKVISEHPIFGTGTGDVKDELALKYLEMDEQLMAEKKINSHNQYLHSWAALGLPGILSLLAILVIGLFEGLRKRKDLLTVFILLVGANIFVESMFEVQAGIVFFAFFYGMLLTERKYRTTNF